MPFCDGVPGIGGDAFCLFFSAATREVTAMLGCGRSPAGLTMEASILMFLVPPLKLLLTLLRGHP